MMVRQSRWCAPIVSSNTLAAMTSAVVLVAVLLIGAFLSSCSSNGKQWNPDDYTVKSGDTL